METSNLIHRLAPPVGLPVKVGRLHVMKMAFFACSRSWQKDGHLISSTFTTTAAHKKDIKKKNKKKEEWGGVGGALAGLNVSRQEGKVSGRFN